jgi:uncharacterized protein (TIGR01777 family)
VTDDRQRDTKGTAMQAPLRIAITGATGFIGSHLAPTLRAEGHTVVPVSRKPLPNGIQWNPDRGELDPAPFEGIDVVIHLAGEGIADKRWSEDRKRAIRESRTGPTALLAKTLASLDRPPRVLISMSAVGIYGDRGDEVLTEASPLGNDFLAQACIAWEAAGDAARAAGIRVVHPRMGIVLSPDGSALAKMLPVFRLGIGGRLGSGRQWLSWVAIDDAMRGLRHCALHEELSGPVNLTSPQPSTNADFTRILATVLRRPAVIPVPTFALKLLFGEMAEGTVLASQRTLPARLADAGFQFRFAAMDMALRHLLARA